MRISISASTIAIRETRNVKYIIIKQSTVDNRDVTTRSHTYSRGSFILPQPTVVFGARVRWLHLHRALGDRTVCETVVSAAGSYGGRQRWEWWWWRSEWWWLRWRRRLVAVSANVFFNLTVISTTFCPASSTPRPSVDSVHPCRSSPVPRIAPWSLSSFRVAYRSRDFWNLMIVIARQLFHPSFDGFVPG